MAFGRKNVTRLLAGIIFFLACAGAGVALAGNFREIDPGGLRLTYRSRTSITEDFVVYVDTMSRIAKNGMDLFQIEIVEETGKKVVALVRSDDWQPLLIRYLDKDGRQAAQIEYKNNLATFDIPAQKLHKTVKLNGYYYDNSTLYHILRAFPFGEKKKVYFNLVMDGRDGSPAGPIGMYVREIGKEKLKVPAGVFDAYKLEMGVAGAIGFFAQKYRYYFWYTTGEPHYLLRYQDREGSAVTELVAKD